MKKLFAILLAVAMIAALSVTAFAADKDSTGAFDPIAVQGTYNASGYTDTYLITLEYAGLSFTYNAAGYTWDGAQLKWVESAEAAWSGSTTGTITVTNKSSKAITATFANTTPANGATISYTDDGEADFESNVLSLGAAVAEKTPTATGTAVSETITVTVGGDLTATGKICDITVTIA